MIRITLQKSLIALATCTALTAHAQGQSSLAGQRDAIARVSAESGAQVSIHAATGAARFVSAAPGAKLRAQSRASASTDAAKHNDSLQFLTENASLFGITNAAAEFGTARIDKDRYGATHLTYKQVYRGVPVFGAEMKTHFDAADNLVVANGTFVPGIDVNPNPSRSAEDAKAAALAKVRAELARPTKAKLSTSEPTLTVYREGLAQGIEGANHLAWQVEVGNRADVREFVFVDAHTGKVIDKISGIHEAKNRRAYDSQGATAPGPNYPASPFWVEGNPFPTGNTEADNMIAASSEIYDLFKTAFGRDSFDGKGATMDSVFNRGDQCPNASWNGLLISFCPGTTTDDITAHEWGHAYTEYTHALIYAWQPGALNEAYSDIWGETVDRINGRGGDTPDALRTAGACTASTTTAQVNVTAPVAISGIKTTGTAAFGPQSFSLATADVVVVNSGGTTDACTTPFTNAAAVAGKIAFIDRGTCAFAIKTKNAQLNGAIGVIIGNNTTGIINPSGVDATITIPTLTVGQSDGTAIKAQTGVRASLLRGPGTDASVRWLMGEDSSAFGGAIRDMYNPVCYGNPGKVSDVEYVCAATPDSGGVHSNSGVPNHGYALLVDGGTYNGQSIAALGLTKAAHMYYRAQSVYQGPASGFADHADALQRSCTDLTGLNLANLKTGAPSGEVMNATDCAQVAKMAVAVEMRTPPTQCNFQPMLAKSPPPLCSTGSVVSIASDNFDGGKRGGLRWLLSNAGTAPEFTTRNWGVVNNMPGGRAGYGIFATDFAGGTCSPGGDQSGVLRLDSPEITIPAAATTLRMTFDHWMSSEVGFDGGNLKISVNGGAWQVVKATDFIYNPYNGTLSTAASGNTNPMAGEPAFTGADGGSVLGSWGRSIINLAPYAVANDKVKLRFEMGNDGCGGAFGWYLDDVMVYRCQP
jgi:Zn-dependent metalloprotease